MEQPLVSVIIPVYNVEQYLEECVDSVLHQTYQNIEIILVDDGATDSSGKICDRYAEQYSSVHVIHKENGGLSSARNCGFNHAVGEYVYFLDSDDYILPEAIETLVAIAETNKADVVFFDALSFSETDSSFKGKDNYVRKHTYQPDKGISVLEQLQKNGEYHSAVPLLFLNREFLSQQGICFVNGIVFEDMIYTFQVFSLATVVCQCNQSFYQRRFRADSIMTSKKNKKYFDSCFFAYQTIQHFALEKGITDTEVFKGYIARLAFNVFNNYEKLSVTDKKCCSDTLKKAKKDILNEKAYGNTALKMRCYGKVFWIVYKVFEKIVG